MAARRSRHSSGLIRRRAPADFEEWLQNVFPGRRAEDPRRAGQRERERQFLRRIPGQSARTADLHWLAGKGQAVSDDGSAQTLLRGTFYDINERKQLEARLLAVNETLEARVAELREEARTLEVLNRTGIAIGAELDLERLVQTVTDAGVELSGAQFGAFFYNVIRPDGEAYTLYTLSGAPREAFAKFPMPRNTADVRADVSRHRHRPLCRYSCRSALRKDGAL